MLAPAPASRLGEQFTVNHVADLFLVNILRLPMAHPPLASAAVAIAAAAALFLASPGRADPAPAPAPAAVPAAPAPVLTPYRASGIYARGEKVGWKVALPSAPAGGPAVKFSYVVKRNGLVPIASGPLAGAAPVIEVAVDVPAMLYVEVTSSAPGSKPVVVGAAVDPTHLAPVVPRPADFDAFWAEKLQQLAAIPPEPVLTPGDSGRPGIEYATLRLNNLRGAHVYGQLAKPAGPGPFPAVLMMQWAGGPYPLQKAWVVDRAAEGWLVLDVAAHDVPVDLPQSFYDALPALIKNYSSLYNNDRDRNYFLQMYLGDYRALDYLAGRPDWNGRILVVNGTSMGGQQSFAMAGLHPKVTHLIVHVPAGADSNGPLHGRIAAYPNWDLARPGVAGTALYFDSVNFAPRIKAKCLVSMGFLDTAATPAGIWTEFNLIPGPKEVVPLVDSPHNHLATPAQQQPFLDRAKLWFDTLAQGREPALLPLRP